MFVRLRRFLFFAGVVVLFDAMGVWAADGGQTPKLSALKTEHCQLAGGEESAVLAIVPPQTLRLADGRFVQLAEIWLPQKSSGLDAYDPSAATSDLLKELALGQRVEVRYGGRQRDRYGVYIGHVYAAGPNSSDQPSAGMDTPKIWLQERLVAAGLALVYPQGDNHACAKALLQVETQARAAGAGHWGRALFKVLTATDTRRLMDLAQTYQIVEGKVISATESTSALILNFGDKPKQDFAVSLPKSIQKQFADRKDAASWKGQKVRVRGWIERRRGPFMTVSEAAQIEVLSPAVAEPPKADALAKP